MASPSGTGGVGREELTRTVDRREDEVLLGTIEIGAAVNLGAGCLNCIAQGLGRGKLPGTDHEAGSEFAAGYR